MARKYFLVSENVYKRLNEEVPILKEPEKAPTADVHVESNDTQLKTIDFDLTILPRPIRHKSKVIIHHLSSHITLTADGRVNYPDRSTGSFLYTLLTYFLLPFSRKARPLDAPKFIDLVQKFVPEDILKASVPPADKIERKIPKNSFKWKRTR